MRALRASGSSLSSFALRTLVPSLLIGALLLCAGELAHSASNTIDVHSVKPGMKGYGLTVFRGRTPERFEVEVIDVLHNFRPDQDLILVRTSHPVLDKAIVVGGMSGSPIYLEGKLAGAYSYGWMFGKEPVAGVTPIDNMLAEMARPVDPAIWKALRSLPKLSSAAPTRGSPERLAGLPPYLGKEHAGALRPLEQHALAYGYGESRDALRPAATPVMLSGLHERMASVLNAQLERFGLVALQAGGGAAPSTAGSSAAPPHFEDGGSIGVALIRGDISATAIGTVTHVVGDRLVAFGHPMLNAGQPALPTCTARVLHVLASESRSFKIAEAGDILGTLVHDRQAAIVVDTRLKADSVPLHLRVLGVQGAPRTEWNVELASHRMLTPMLAFSALGNALSVTAAENSDAVFEVDSRVRIAGHGTIEVVDVGYTPSGLDNPMALSQLRLFDLIEAAYGNPFEQARIERIDVDLDVRFTRDVITVLDALVPATEVDPDRDLNVYLTVQKFDQPPEVKIVPVHVPASAAGEKIELAFEPGNQVQLERPEPENLDQIIDNVRMGFPSTSLVVSLKLPSQGLRLRGHVVRNLPGSALDSLQLGGAGTRPTAFATQSRTELPMHEVVVGSARITLDVRREPRK
ncbi:MAG: hypothetical protein ACHQ53_12405 [Polyangiales bacterium]